MKYKLSDIAIKVTDGEHGTVKDDENGQCYLLSCKNIKNGRIEIGQNERRIDNETMETLNKRTQIEKGDILITTVGTIGEMAMVRDDNVFYSFQRSVGVIKPDTLKVIPEYLYYAIMNEANQINTLIKGAVQKCLFINDLKSLEIDLPDLETQKKIVRILSALDQIIELNNNEGNTLQSIINTQYCKVFSENENNNKVKASDLFDYEGGYSYTSAELADESDIGMMTIKNFERTGGFKVDGFKALSPKKGIIKTAALYDIFISCTDVTQNADIIGNAVMLLDTDKYSTVTYSMDLVRIIPKINRFALYAILSSKDFKSFALGYKSGTTVLHLNKKCLAEYEIALPDKKSLDVFGATIEKACKKIAINLAENRCLSQIRDSLLPKLMSGDVSLDKVTNG